MARFMFFNGLSRTRRLGDIDSLPNENIADNLAFSFQMQVLCNEYYPGLTRRIYLKGYRYNMHLKQRYLLIEMGAQTNTYEECMNSCVPLAQMLDLELSGKQILRLIRRKDESKMRTIVSRFAMSGGWAQNGIEVFILMIY